MNDIPTEYFEIQAEYFVTGDGIYPYRAVVEGQTWVIRVNDFPERDMYTLIIDDQEIVDFNGWPDNWANPDFR